MKAILPHFFEFINSKFPQYIGVLEELGVQESGSKKRLKATLQKRIERTGNTRTFLDIINSISEWKEDDVQHIEKIEDMHGVNDLMFELYTGDFGKVQFNLDEFFKKENLLVTIMTVIAIYEWLHTKVLPMSSLELDIEMSKNTRRTWLEFFFNSFDNTFQYNENSYRFFNARKITPKDYFEIWNKFVRVDISDFDQSITDKVDNLEKGWVVSKDDLKTTFNKRPKDIKMALLDAVDQPDYPQSWPKVIPDKDKFPYSVSLFIARELSLS